LYKPFTIQILFNEQGWIECVGCADRSCYDLERHEAVTKKGLFASNRLDTPIQVEELVLTPNMGPIAKVFQKKAQVIKEALALYTPAQVAELQTTIAAGSQLQVTLAGGEVVTLEPTMVQVKTIKKTKDTVEYTPAVIEPSFGIGRILYGLLEHSYYLREGDEQRGVLSFTPAIAPVKVLLAPLSGKPEFEPLITLAADKLRKLAIAVCFPCSLSTNPPPSTKQYKIDDSSNSIGRRYARADELGIPFGVTVDFQSVKDSTVTLRERDQPKPQIRLALDEVPGLVAKLVSGEASWSVIVNQYPQHVAQEV